MEFIQNVQCQRKWEKIGNIQGRRRKKFFFGEWVYLWNALIITSFLFLFYWNRCNKSNALKWDIDGFIDRLERNIFWKLPLMYNKCTCMTPLLTRMSELAYVRPRHYIYAACETQLRLIKMHAFRFNGYTPFCAFCRLSLFFVQHFFCM